MNLRGSQRTQAEIAAVGIKRCSKCGEGKPYSSFSPDRRNVIPIQAACKSCKSVANMASLNASGRREAINESRRQLRRQNPAIPMLADARKRAKRRGLPFQIELEDIVVPERCPVFGFPLTIGAGAPSNSSPSLDAIDPQRGYVKGNIQVISALANRMKNDATRDQLIAFARWVFCESTRGISG